MIYASRGRDTNATSLATRRVVAEVPLFYEFALNYLQ